MTLEDIDNNSLKGNGFNNDRDIRGNHFNDRERQGEPQEITSLPGWDPMKEWGEFKKIVARTIIS